MKNRFKYADITLRISVFLIILIWCSGFSILQIFSVSNPLGILLPFARYSYSLVCHQEENRSFVINNMHLFVCARCSGIYTGALITSFVIIFIKKLPSINLKLALISLIPLFADIILYNSGVYDYSKIIAFITGLLPGSILFIYILSSFENFLEELNFFNG